MKKILYYYLNFRPGQNGRIIFRLEGDAENKVIVLSPSDFAAVAAVLAQSRTTYDVGSGTFVSFDDNQMALTDQHLIA